MRHQLVALLGGGIKAHGVVHTVVGAEGHFLVAAIDAGAAGIDQMFNRIMATRFKYIIETNDVAFYIDIRVLDAITHTGLGCKVDNNIKLVFSEELVDKVLVSNTSLHKGIVRIVV